MSHRPRSPVGRAYGRKSMDDFGILNPRFVQRVKEDWERAKAEVKRTTAPILGEAERLFEDAFRAPAKGPNTPLDGCDWERVRDDEETLRERLERIVADLPAVQRQTVTLNDPGSIAARF